MRNRIQMILRQIALQTTEREEGMILIWNKEQLWSI